MKISYQVRAEYYHYNTGMANNGQKIISIPVSDLSHARNVKEQINQCSSENGDEEIDGTANEAYLDGDGYFTSKAWIVKVTEETIN